MAGSAAVGRKKWWLLDPVDASGISWVKAAPLPRYAPERPRRKRWRPPLRGSLSLFVFTLLAGTAAIAHHNALDRRLARLLRQADAAPFEIKRIRQELAEQELDEKTLSRELDARFKHARSQKTRAFYVVLDTKQRKFAFKYGDKVVRDACMDIGAPQTIVEKSGARWTFAPVTGAFSVKEKLENPPLEGGSWVYAINRQPTPSLLSVVAGGLGKYVIVLSDGYVIHSPPPPESPLKMTKPGSFMVPETDLAAIWRRVSLGTRVYVF